MVEIRTANRTEPLAVRLADIAERLRRQKCITNHARDIDCVPLEHIRIIIRCHSITHAMELFGKSAQDLNPLIEVGSEGIAAYAQEAHDMGAVLDEEALTSLGEMDDSFQRVEQAGTALKNTIGTALAPVITQIATAISNLSAWFQNLDPSMQKTIITIVGVVAAIVPAIAAVTKIIATVQALSGVFSALSMGPAALVVAAIAAIIAIGVTLYNHWDEICECDHIEVTMDLYDYGLAIRQPRFFKQHYQVAF